MAHPTVITCSRCSQKMDATLSSCPHCRAPHQLTAGPAEVPPALAILVVLGLLTGVLTLIGLVMRVSPHHAEAQTAPVAAATPSASTPPPPPTPAPPRPSATPRPSPVAPPPPKLPEAPAPGAPPQKLGLPPPAPLPVSASSDPSPAPRYPPPP